MKYSAGIIPYRYNNQGELEFFLGHPGGKFWSKKNYWAYLKGGVEKGENWFTAAKREFEEESGFSLADCNDGDFIPLGTTLQNSKKTVIAYAIKIDYIDTEKCFSNLCEDNETPEIDKYGWFDFDTTLNVTNKSHIIFYERIKDILTNNE